MFVKKLFEKQKTSQKAKSSVTALHKRNVIKIQNLKFFAIFQKVPLSEWQYFELTGRAVLLAHKSLVWLSKQSFNIEPCVQTKEKIYLFVVQLLENSWRIDELSEHQWDAVQHTKAEGLNQQIMSSCPASNSWIWDNLPAESLCSLPSDFFICIQLCLSPLKCLKRLIGLVHYQEYPTLAKTNHRRWKGEGKRKYFSVVPISSCERAQNWPSLLSGSQQSSHPSRDLEYQGSAQYGLTIALVLQIASVDSLGLLLSWFLSIPLTVEQLCSVSKRLSVLTRQRLVCLLSIRSSH